MVLSNMQHVIKTKVKHEGFFVDKYLKNVAKSFSYEKLMQLAEKSLEDFRNASPTIEISANWSYNIVKNDGSWSVTFENSTIENGVNIAILIDVGHGTVSGKWVPGTNYLKEPIEKTYERINNLLLEAQ